MKREFLVAVILLSGGMLLASAFLKSANHAEAQENSAQTTPRVASADGVDLVANVDISSPASIQSLIRNAAEALAHSRPLQAKLRYKVDMFGQQISGPGRYFQAGQGTRKTRIEFEFGFNDIAVQLHQFCDGDLLYSLTSTGDDATLEFVDLRQLDSLKNHAPAPGNVRSWLSVGSLTGLLDQLGEHFEFTVAEPGQLDTIPVIECVGTWRADAVARLLHEQIDAKATADGFVRWQQLPEHLPHQVRLTLGADNRFPYFPYRIVFEQFEIRDGAQFARPVAVLELYEVRHSPELSDDMFRLPSVNTEAVDATEFYKHRIKQFTNQSD